MTTAVPNVGRLATLLVRGTGCKSVRAAVDVDRSVCSAGRFGVTRSCSMIQSDVATRAVTLRRRVVVQLVQVVYICRPK